MDLYFVGLIVVDGYNVGKEMALYIWRDKDDKVE